LARSYASPLRTAQAAETRRRILDAAGDRFAADGYAGASLSQIAADAGVSLETVKLNGPKSALLLGAFDQAFTGAEEPGAIHEREVGAQLMAAPDEHLVEGFVTFVTGANVRIAHLWPSLLAAASGDPSVAQALDGLQRRRRSDFMAAVTMLRERGLLHREAPDAELAAALSFLVSPESYTQLVLEYGWPEDAYRSWLLDAVHRLILTN
jgi:AcrR family transcriptional regulator